MTTQQTDTLCYWPALFPLKINAFGMTDCSQKAGGQVWDQNQGREVARDLELWRPGTRNASGRLPIGNKPAQKLRPDGKDYLQRREEG